MIKLFKVSSLSKILFFIFLLTSVSLPSNALAATIQNKTIKSIANINSTVNQGEKYTLPTTVTAVMNDNSKKKVAVVWSIDTYKSNQTTYIFEGTVQGYNKKVILTLTVKKYIKSIANINKTVNQGDNFTLPSKIAAKMSDNTTQQVSITWTPSKVTTAKAGKFTFQGTVKGYPKKVILTLTVLQLNQANTNGNLVNEGLVAEKGDWIYYSNLTENGKLYKIKKDGTGRTQLSNDKCKNINIIDDWVYYANYSNDGTLYKIKTDGTGRIQLDDTLYIKNINVVKNWIYYRSGTYHFYKIKTDGTEKTKFNADVEDIAVSGDWIYYTEAYTSNIYKIKTDGSSTTKLNDDHSYYINIVNNWIYYSNGDQGNKIYKVKTDGSGRTKLNNCNSEYINVAGNWIYYVDDSHYGSYNRIYKIKTDGSGETQLNNNISKNLNIAGDWIYYDNGSDYHNLYKVKTDGSSDQLIN